MDVNEIKYWLFSADRVARNWRLAPENQVRVGELVDELARTPGGMARTKTHAILAEEQKRFEAMDLVRSETEKRISELKELKYLEAAAFGVTREVFEFNWPTMLKEMVDKGTANAEYERLLAAKRRGAARTF